MKASYKVGAVLVLCYLVAWLDRMAIALTLPSMEADIGLDPQTKGFIISAFFVGYALCQVPGGILADRFGPRRVIIGALVWWSVFTSVTGAMWSVASMLVARFLFGMGEGVFPASVWKVIAQWFSKKEMLGLSLARWSKAFSTSRPVMSVAWTIRRRVCPPS